MNEFYQFMDVWVVSQTFGKTDFIFSHVFESRERAEIYIAQFDDHKEVVFQIIKTKFYFETNAFKRIIFEGKPSKMRKQIGISEEEFENNKEIGGRINESRNMESNCSGN